MENKSLSVLRDTGMFIQVIGWVKILALFLMIYFDLQYADEYDFIREKWLSFSYTDLAISFCIGVIFIILGDRIRKNLDKNTRIYLWTILIISIITSLLNFINSGNTAILIIFMICMCINALLKIRNLKV